MTRRRLTGILASGLALATGALGLAPGQVAWAGPTARTVEAAGPPAGTKILTTASSGFASKVFVLGADAGHIVWLQQEPADDLGQCCNSELDTVAVAGGAARLLGPGPDSPTATLAGSTLVFRDFRSQPHWRDIDTGASGLGRTNDISTPTWQTATPGGGAWVSNDDPEVLEATTTADPNATPSPLATLPAGSSFEAKVADTHGIVLVSDAGAVDYYSFSAGTLSALNTGGRAVGCTSVTATAVGCFTAADVVIVHTDGPAPTVVPATDVSRVAVGPTATAWLAAGRLVIDRGGVLTRTPFTVSGVAAAGDDFAYSRIDTRAGGIYRTATGPAGASLRLLVRAPAVALQTFTVALTAGRVAWIDNSGTSYPVRSRRVLPRGRGPAFGLGATVVVSPGSAFSPVPGAVDTSFSGLAVSGRRTLFVGTGASRDVILADSRGRHLLAHNGVGEVGLSGSNALWRADPPTTPGGGRFLVRDLTTGRVRNVTAATGGVRGIGGDLRAALYGRYLAYDVSGSVRRRDLMTGRTVRISGSGSGITGGSVATAGDWVAWQAAPRSTIFYRDARTMGPIRAIRGGRTLESVAQAGLVTSTSTGRQLFRRWGTTADRALPTARGPVVADGGLMAWIGVDGRPRIAPLPASAARPQALGAPFVPARLRIGHAWTIDQPTSQVLSACTVVIRRGSRVVTRLSCAAAYAGQGEAVASWGGRVAGRPVARGRYTWQIVAADRSGSILAGDGDPGRPVSGTLTVTR